MAGWLRWPTVSGDRVVFVAEDDLWTAPLAGGIARRLTTGLGAAARPRFSPDGATLAFDGAEEGAREVYAVDADGGPVRRLTWQGDAANVLGWTSDGRVRYTSAFAAPFFRDTHAWAVGLDGGPPERLPFGPVAGWAEAGPRLVLCRPSTDLATRKGYRGGRMGVLWAREREDAPFRRLAYPANVASPCWLAGRLWFVADPDGPPQIVSATLEQGELRDVVVHSRHPDLAARYPSTDGRTLVWAHGGDLWRLRPGEEPQRIEVEVRSQRTERQRRFTSAASALEDVDLHPDGHSVALTVRGQVVTMGHWEGPADVLPAGPGRLRLARWVAADRLLVVSDGGGDEVLEVHRLDGSEVRRYEGLDHGRILAAQVDPTGTRVALTDQRHGLYLLDLGTGGWTEVDRPPAGEVGSLDWSADGRYLAWARPEGVGGPRSRLRLLDVTTGERADLTSGDHLDFAPSFDPAGHLLYFLSGRDFDPVDETHGFGYAFVRGTRPYAIPLRSDVRDPFRPDPRPLEPHKSTGPRGADALHRAVELAGLTDRLVPFPIAEGRYTQLVGLTGHVLLVRAPIRGTLDRSWYRPGPPRADSSLLVWDFDKQELTELNPRISSARVDRRREHLAIASGGRLRVVSAKLDKGQRDELKKTEGRADRKSGWIDLGRARVSVDPGAEWSQMVREAWRLMRDGFWEPGMAGVDWDAILRRYLALVERIATRGELSDLIWCMQGELATSHAYEMGGDYVEPPSYRVGRLGADLVWDPERQGWRISRILRGDPGDRERTSPLAAPGLGLAEGDVVVEIAGARAAGDLPPEAALVHRAGTQVSLGVRTGTGARRVVVDALSDDRPLRYRDWVLANRRRVHEDSGGRIGYVHVPDMGPPGFAEFARDFGRECERDALLVDVRWNRGGHVSQLLLARLTQRRLGWRISRWGAPVPYPYQSVAGPMLALTNEMAGSDGDIFSHAWRRLGLGPLMGTRTWGGVVGISPDHLLVDRGVTTQPEYATWFEDVGYGLENHGAEPDLVVEVGPDDWARGADPQLEAAVSWLARELAAHPPRPAAPGR